MEGSVGRHGGGTGQDSYTLTGNGVDIEIKPDEMQALWGLIQQNKGSVPNGLYNRFEKNQQSFQS